MAELDSRTLARKIAGYSLTKKAGDVCVMDLRGLSSVTDYFVVCHGDSDIQVRAIADAVIEGMRGEGIREWHREGYEFMNWVILDYVDVVVHIFLKETRGFYALERLWGDSEVETITE